MMDEDEDDDDEDDSAALWCGDNCALRFWAL